MVIRLKDKLSIVSEIGMVIKMKSICHLTIADQTAIPRIKREANAAIKERMSCYIVSPGESHTLNGVEYIGVTAPKGRVERFFCTNKAIYKKALQLDADIYQIHSPELLRYTKKLQRKGKKVIFDSHEFYGYQIMLKGYIPSFLRRIISYLYMKYEARICKSIDAVLYVCTVDGKNYFENRAKKTVAVANYIDIGNFPMNKTADKFDAVIYAGAISAARGISHLAQAAKKAGVKLILCGTCASPKYLSELIETYPDTIDYRGCLDWSELAKLYNTVKIGASTLLNKGQYSVIDTLPTKVYEYWWAGLPVIISNTRYASKFISKHKCGICVDPENTDEIANAIKYLLANPDEAARMGENGRSVVINEYNWGVESKKLLELYNNL